MNKHAAWLITNNNVTLNLDGCVYVAPRDYAESTGALLAITQGNYQRAADLLNKAKAVVRRSMGIFTVEGNVIYHNGFPVHNTAATRIIEFADAGLQFMPVVRFLENILQNPSKNSTEAGYKFLELKGLPLTEDGHFLAYKTVRHDYKSKTAGHEPVQVSRDGGKTWETVVGNIPNNVGNILKIERNMVDENRERACSYGLHVGSLGYSGPQGWFYNESAGEKIVIVKVNPRDIVSIPNDATQEKLRVCAYEVIGDFKSAYSVPLVGNEGQSFEASSSASPEVYCDGDNGGCDWSGTFKQLTHGYECPECGSGSALDSYL
jgi:hypothetical protein